MVLIDEKPQVQIYDNPGVDYYVLNGKEIKVIGYELKDYIVATEIILSDNIQTKTFHSIIDIIYKPINTIKIINKVNGNEYY